MTVRADPVSIEALANDLENSGRAGEKPSPPTMDFGPSTAAVQATTAEALRAESGLTEALSRTAADLDANKTIYAKTDADNADLFRPIGR